MKVDSEAFCIITMKVTGDVEIINRLLSSTGIRSKGRCSRAQVGIGQVGSGASKQAALLICTQQDRSGTKYMLFLKPINGVPLRGLLKCQIYNAAVERFRSACPSRYCCSDPWPQRLSDCYISISTSSDILENLVTLLTSTLVKVEVNKHVITDFVNIKIIYPMLRQSVSKSVEMVLQIDPVQLKGFLVLLKMAATGKAQQGVTLAPLLPASKAQIAKLKTKMTISNKSEYPVTAGFPHSLETLLINGCALKKVELRILRLSKLVTLDLSNNCISILPDDWSGLKCLAELKLAKNSLTHLPAKMFSQLSTTAHLDLCENQLSSLPYTLTDLLHLAVLKVDGNKLTCLPQGFGRLQRLFQFSASGNQLAVLPGDFDRLTLQNLDLFGNPLSDIGQPTMTIMEEVGFPSLLELSARSIKNFRVPYSAADIGRRLAEALDEASVCWKCGGACLIPYAQYNRGIDLRRVSSGVTAIDLRGRTRAACSGLLCSASCVLRVQNERVRL